MPIKNLTLGLCLLCVSSAHAQKKIYRVHKGDTLASVASHFDTGAKRLAKANGLSGSHLKPGQRLLIPTTPSRTAHGSTPHLYAVRNGDFDWAIAKRNGITVERLHALNPSIHWSTLQIGTKIRVPGNGIVAKSASIEKVAKKEKAHGYVVRHGDNDWVIAHRLGTTSHKLALLNPGIRLSRLQPGQTIRVPGGTTVATAPASKRIRSRYAVVKADTVTVRRDASRSAAAICTVDQGTRVAVLDRDGDWYQLRFPKGTVGWVRGDFLKAATVVARSERRSSRSKRYVARNVRKHRNTELKDISYEANAGTGDALLLNKATSMRGVRYRWGQASRSGTDCSGFTSQVFRSEGVKLPRTSREQASVGQGVGRESMKPGDLVFFHTGRGHRINHVGIYMGKGKFIHASSGGGKVQVNSLSDGFYRNRFATARRVKSHAVAKAKAKAKPAPVVEEHIAQAEPEEKAGAATDASK